MQFSASTDACYPRRFFSAGGTCTHHLDILIPTAHHHALARSCLQPVHKSSLITPPHTGWPLRRRLPAPRQLARQFRSPPAAPLSAAAVMEFQPLLDTMQHPATSVLIAVARPAKSMQALRWAARGHGSCYESLPALRLQRAACYL
jgi:hypothetical protein